METQYPALSQKQKLVTPMNPETIAIPREVVERVVVKLKEVCSFADAYGLEALLNPNPESEVKTCANTMTSPVSNRRDDVPTGVAPEGYNMSDAISDWHGESHTSYNPPPAPSPTPQEAVSADDALRGWSKKPWPDNLDFKTAFLAGHAARDPEAESLRKERDGLQKLRELDAELFVKWGKEKDDALAQLAEAKSELAEEKRKLDVICTDVDYEGGVQFWQKKASEAALAAFDSAVKCAEELNRLAGALELVCDAGDQVGGMDGSDDEPQAEFLRALTIGAQLIARHRAQKEAR